MCFDLMSVIQSLITTGNTEGGRFTAFNFLYKFINFIYTRLDFAI